MLYLLKRHKTYNKGYNTMDNLAANTCTWDKIITGDIVIYVDNVYRIETIESLEDSTMHTNVYMANLLDNREYSVTVRSNGEVIKLSV